MSEKNLALAFRPTLELGFSILVDVAVGVEGNRIERWIRISPHPQKTRACYGSCDVRARIQPTLQIRRLVRRFVRS